MDTPRESRELYLRHHNVTEGRRLPAAILFTESMLRELGAAVAEWEEMAAKLKRAERDGKVPCSN